MKSKSFDSGKTSASKINVGHNNTFDFIRLYKTAEETRATLQKYKTKSNEGNTHKDDTSSQSAKHEISTSKRKKGKQTAVEMTHISIDGLSLDTGSVAGCSTPVSESMATSTPLVTKEKVKSIMKTLTVTGDDPVISSKREPASTKSKKRNKSVSFMLDDNEELAVKKTKSDDSTTTSTASEPRYKTNKLKKNKKDYRAEKENKVSDSNHSTGSKQDNGNNNNEKTIIKHLVPRKPVDGATSTTSTLSDTTQDKKKKNKLKKSKKIEDAQQTKTDTAQTTTEKIKKAKKKKREPKLQTDTEEEPALKSRKKEIKPEIIAEDLENLSIGENAHTLSSLLDEMTVSNKDKRKKLKKKVSKTKNAKSKELSESQKSEEVKEKKWKRKRWNKDQKTKDTIEGLSSAIIVDNLPLSLLFTYKKVLAECFAKYGLLRNVGVAEVYPSEVPKPVFTTTVYFDTDEAATKALEEDKRMIEGNKVRVYRPLPATQTTAVVRTYGAATEQALSSALAAAGRVRNIRLAVKGKKAMATAFIEFDGPEAVQRAISMAEDIKISGKKIHISKFEIRTKKDKEEKSAVSDADHSDNCDDQK